jgi:hypothetical protein
MGSVVAIKSVVRGLSIDSFLLLVAFVKEPSLVLLFLRVHFLNP